MNKTIKNILLVMILLILFTSCDKRGSAITSTLSDSKPITRELKLLTTNPILKELVDSLDEKNHKIDVLVTSEDTMKIYSPDLDVIEGQQYNSIFYIGANYEPFMKDVLSRIDMNKVNVVNLARGIDIKRFKEDKIELENYYYLTNSENYQIALFSIKNALQEMDHGRNALYDDKYMEISKKIDEMQNEIKEFMNNNPKVYFVSDNDKLQYFCQEYKRDHLMITDYRHEMEDPATSRSSQSLREDKVLFLYTDPLSLKKYSDDIAKYRMKPVKIILYDYETPMLEVYLKNFDNIKKAVDNFRN